VLSERLDKGKGPVRAETFKETPGKAGSQNTEAKASAPIEAPLVACHAKALKNVLDTAYRWKSTPTSPPFPVDMGGESHWKKILASKPFALNAEKRAYVYALWGNHNSKERDYFIRTLNESMSDTSALDNMGTLQRCNDMLATWPALKADYEHKNYFKVAWLVYTSWASPLSKRKLRAARRAAEPEEDEFEETDAMGFAEFTTLENKATDIYGNNHPTPTQLYNAWIDFALHQAKQTILRMVRQELSLTQSGNFASPKPSNILVAKLIVLGEYVVHRLCPNTGNNVLWHKFI